MLHHRTSALRSPPSAFSLVELLVVITIIGILISLLLPAVQAAREAARNMRCKNNLKQIGLALNNFAVLYKGFPASRTRVPTQHGWVVDILPYVEAEPLKDHYHFDQEFYTADNQPVVSAPLAFMQCPSTPDQKRLVDLIYGGVNYGKAAAGDYWVHHKGIVNFSGRACRNPMGSDPSSTGEPLPLIYITDGLSQTILVEESAMKPENWIFGVKQADPVGNTFSGASGPGWAYCLSWPWKIFSRDGFTGYKYDSDSGLTEAEYEAAFPCAINCNNSGGVYAFHPSGANVLFCDGSVHFLSVSLNSGVYLKMSTADGADIIQGNQY